MKIFIISSLISLTLSAPVDPVGPGEVELIDPVRTRTEDPQENDNSDGFVPVIIIRGNEGGSSFPSIFPQIFGTNPVEGGGPGLNFPFFSSAFPFATSSPSSDNDEIDIKSDNNNNNQCGLICLMFKRFEDQLKHLDDEIKKVETEIKEQTEETNDDEGETTYEEKVLPDGTVVKINKTVIRDSDDNGNGFVFKVTSFITNDGSNTKNNDEPEEDEVEITEEDVDDGELPTEIIGDENNDAENEVSNVPEKLIRARRSRAEFVQTTQNQRLSELDPEDPQTNEVETPANNNNNNDRSRQLPVGQLIVQISPNGVPVYGFQRNTSPSTFQRLRVLPSSNQPEGTMSYGDDTRVNDLLSADDKRGGLIRVDPNAELIREEEDGTVVSIDDDVDNYRGDFFNQNQDQTFQQFNQQQQSQPLQDQNPWEQQKIQ